MQDIINKYKKHKSISNIGIVVSSIIIALGINFLLIDGTEIGKNLKTSVLNANNKDEKSDIYFELDNKKVLLKTSKNIKDVKSISLSTVYNPDNLIINEIKNDENNIIKMGEEKGISSFIINYDKSKNIKPSESILEFEVEKKEEKTENLNIINANFTDEAGESYMLSTSGISF